MLVGYMRVSSDSDRQSTDLQRDALLAAGVDPRHLFEDGVWGATEQKVHLSPAPARKPLWRLVSSGKPSFCRTLAGTDARPSKRMKSSAEKSFSKTKSG